MNTNQPAFKKLLEAMKRLSNEVNDHEICKRLESLILTSKEDLNMLVVNSLLEKPLDFEPKEIPEPYTQYVKHFIYMVKRNEKQGVNKHVYIPDSPEPANIKKPSGERKRKIESSTVVINSGIKSKSEK
ncbi:MAG: hypothetical protein H7A23_19430 [Leptospiraceae bacterium]|nr:hypothetical protein [Leptospiraceae bacterium]MCP5496727.1 hypothetical protein [Leptospiraceae bacterium]